MLDTDMVKSTDNRPLQEAPDSFNGVGVDNPPDIFIGPVVDHLMPDVMVSNSGVGRPFIGEDGFCFRDNVLEGNFMQGLPGPVSSDLEYDFPYIISDETIIDRIAFGGVKELEELYQQ